jgi:hypothetical protein
MLPSCIKYWKNWPENQVINFIWPYPWVKGIQVCSNKGPGPVQRGDNHKNVRMGWGHLKILRTMKPEKLNFT